jgi:signal transduction histidine kinase
MEPLFWGFLFYSFIQGFKQQELQDSQIRLKDEKKITELLLDLMTHDLINYNTVALGSLELLTELINEDKDLRDLVSASTRAIKGNSLLIENVKILHQLLEMRDSIHLHPVSLRSVIDSAREKTQRIYSDIPLKLELVTKTETSNVVGHAILENVFTNLFSNSVRYRKPEQKEPQVQIKIEQDQAHIVVIFSDGGIGIPDDRKEHIFDRFSAEHPDSKGTGLGLSISKRIVESLGGEMTVSNRIDSPNESTDGVTFTIKLKRA